MNNILKQTITNMRQQPLLTGLTIAGTALSICLIMIVMMTREAQIIDYGCEPYRSRTLYAKQMMIKHKNGGYSSGTMGMKPIREIFAKLKSPERMALFSPMTSSVNVNMQGRENVQASAKAVNAAFFDVFQLKFIEGRAFTQEECNSNMPIAIISQKTCRDIFGQDKDLKGRTFLIENHEYQVAGIVEDVSPLLTSAYSEIWVPVSTIPGVAHPLDNVMNPEYSMGVALQAKSSADFSKIKNETERALAAYNKSISPDTLDLVEQPDIQEMYVNREWSNKAPDLTEIHLHYALIFAVLLIVPAINIASMTQSRLRQRKEEIGIRRAFGARRSTILMQTVTESLLHTLASGLMGLLLCLMACFMLGNYIFPYNSFEDITDKQLDADILFSPEIYGWALLFCLLLNLLSNIVPAWRASRSNIVEALK